MKARAALLVVLAALVPGCSCESSAARALKSRPPTRAACGAVKAPPGSKWKSASVEIDLLGEKRIASGRQLPIETTTWSVVPRLVLDGPDGFVSVPLAGALRDSLDESALVHAADANWKIVWAPDGRGVACIGDGGDGWLWVCCDGSRPFHCHHLRIAAPGDGDPAAKGPRFRDLALDMMASKPPHADGPDLNEWSDLVVLVAESDDRDLLDMFGAAAVREKSGLLLSALPRSAIREIQAATQHEAHLRVASELGEDAAQIRKDALAALRAPAMAGSAVATNAALLLGSDPSSEAQRLLAQALASEDWAPAASVLRDPEWPRAVAWSLAGSIDGSIAVDREVEAQMTLFIKRESKNPELSLPLLYALAIRGSPRAREFVAATAKECEETTLPPWPASLDELWKVAIEEHGALKYSLAAWAKAASTKPK